MFRSSWSLLRDSGRIFLEAAPAGVDPAAVARALADDGDVVGVHDLHVWTVTSGFPALAAHVLVSPDADCHGARRRLQHLLEDRFNLHHVTLQVQDDGIGMSPEVLARVGTPFFTTRREGIGLGLAQCQRLVGKVGGSFKIASTSGAGTTVTVTLPIAG